MTKIREIMVKPRLLYTLAPAQSKPNLPKTSYSKPSLSRLSQLSQLNENKPGITRVMQSTLSLNQNLRFSRDLSLN